MAAGIQAIDKKSVHRICSGQVVLNLATAVKELVENSIDAGATIIEIRLKEHGSELVEVVDNGMGVEEKNFQGLTLKHHTSKLQDFADLVSVETFGFRGEALSSLCALSKLTIVTCHAEAKVGTRLEYDHNGKIVKWTPCARKQGTTVSLSQLFSTLPVRHKEFQRNLKKEFAKMVQVLNGYCIVATGVKISCTSINEKGKKTTIISTNGNPGMRENITNVFGSKQLNSLMEFVQHQPGDATAEEFGLKSSQRKDLFCITGYISKCDHGLGRSSTDRQFFFINKRPCDLAKLSKVVNEVYHMYNRHQYPLVALKVSLEKESVDVNVTPDKRQVFLENEKLLLATVKTSLIKMYEPRGGLYDMASPVQSSMVNMITSAQSPQEQNQKKAVSSTLANMKRSFSSAFAKDDSKHEASPMSKQRCLDAFVSFHEVKSKPSEIKSDPDLKSSPDSAIASQESSASQSSDSASLQPIYDIQTFDDSMSKEKPFNQLGSRIIENEKLPSDNEKSDFVVTQIQSNNKEDDIDVIDFGLVSDKSEQKSDSKSNVAQDIKDISIHHLDGSPDMKTSEQYALHPIGKFTETKTGKTFNRSPGNIISLKENKETNEHSKAGDDEIQSHCEEEDLDGLHLIQVAERELDQPEKVKRKEQSVSFSMSQLRERLQVKRESDKQESEQVYRKFRATICPSENGTAEEELKKEIRKDMFPKMEVIGQFNLGFIIGKLGPDLFIIDQHATDEKYNFENLQKNTVIQSQKLIQPQTLELTAANESILVDNLEVFQKNGFDFLIDEDGIPTQRVKLASMPVSKNWIFGKEDIEELIFMLTDSPGVMCRPTRVRQMFASRACRSAIMIGTALNKAEMKKLVCHMGTLDQPWNCPHGRPTMRHLISLQMLPD